MTAAPDPEALVVALTLAPATWSRNRFFELYKDASVRRARRRATLVRCVAADLAGKPEVPPMRDNPKLGPPRAAPAHRPAWRTRRAKRTGL
jgi:hypothetical protein